MENQKITYRKCGDYYIPNLSLSKVENITLNKYGRARLKYLKENKKVEYQSMIIQNTLTKHLSNIQETAQKRVDIIVEKLKANRNLTEKMKNENQLYWVGMMNNFKNQAEEIVMREIIYV